jgi:hypothetical protein
VLPDKTEYAMTNPKNVYDRSTITTVTIS